MALMLLEISFSIWMRFFNISDFDLISLKTFLAITICHYILLFGNVKCVMLKSLILQSVQVIVDKCHLAHQSHPLCRSLVVVHVQLGLQVVDELLEGGRPMMRQHNFSSPPLGGTILDYGIQNTSIFADHKLQSYV